MSDEDRVASVGRESSIGFVAQLELGQNLAAFKTEVSGRETFYFGLRAEGHDPEVADADATHAIFRGAVRHR